MLRHLGVLGLVAGRTTNARPCSFRKSAFWLVLFLSIIDTPNYAIVTPAPSAAETAVIKAARDPYRNIDLYLRKWTFKMGMNLETVISAISPRR